MLGFVAGMVFAMVLVHMYEIATGTYVLGKLEMIERRDPPVTVALMVTSVIAWTLIGLLPRRIFLTAIGAGAGCVAGYFLAWGLAGVRLGDPLYLEYQIGIRERMPFTIPACAAVGVLVGFILAGMRTGKPQAAG
ncbi:MAG: hypothetical protein GX575_00205 [Candidatus Anammoximicrobium sp.]|nr:hypothetical protein [Candidatus Anammoximicrobium sp.]